MLDPGIGFGKDTGTQHRVAQAGKHLVKTDGPLLWGVSRKSVVGPPDGARRSRQRLHGTLGLAAVADHGH